MMETKKVKDIMLSLQEYATVSFDATIYEALIALSKSQMGLTYDRHHHRAVLVLDEDGHVIGKLSHWAILRSLEPKFFQNADQEILFRSGLSHDFIQRLRDNFSMLSTNLNFMCKEAAKIKVKDAMVPINESIDEEAFLTEAIRLMVLSHCQSMLVIRGKAVVGILRMSDVFEEVADIIRNSCINQQNNSSAFGNNE